MPEYIVEVSRTVITDIDVTAEDENDAITKAIKVAKEDLDWMDTPLNDEWEGRVIGSG